jgi:hypothetical protein
VSEMLYEQNDRVVRCKRVKDAPASGGQQ